MAEPKKAKDSKDAQVSAATAAAEGAPQDDQQPGTTDLKAAVAAAPQGAATQLGVASVATGGAVPRAEVPSEDLVVAVVPKAYGLRMGADHTLIQIPKGTQKLPRAIAEHQYSKDNGVEIIAAVK